MSVTGIWSPSKLRMWGWCQFAWGQRYIHGRKEPPSVATAFGHAFDHGASIMLEDGIPRGKVGPASVGADAFAWMWEMESLSIPDWQEEKPGELKDQGVRLIKAWHGSADALVPLSVQERFEVRVDSTLSLEGILDFRADVQGKAVIGDIKTAGRAWRSKESREAGVLPAKALQSLQAPAYTLLASTQLGRPIHSFEFHVCARGGRSDVDIIRLDVPASARKGYFNQVRLAQAQAVEAEATGRFLPTAHMCGHHLCSKRFCAYWRECIAEFGGERPE